MNLTPEDERLLEDACGKHGVSPRKIVEMLRTIRDFELKERRRGMFDKLEEILRRKDRSGTAGEA